jgi:hypothetical protein
LKIRELDSEQRKIYINSCQVYQAYMDEVRASYQFHGGMRWKKTGDKEYLFKTRGGNGFGKSMGVRSPETEAIFDQFHERKDNHKERFASLKDSLVRQARLCVAVNINRMPKIPAQILRQLDKEGVLGKGISVLGTHALYAYEASAGVIIDNDIMETMDVDLLYNAQKKLKLSAEMAHSGLIGLLKKIDKSFEIPSDGHYRAINNRGFMVELVKKTPEPPFKIESQFISNRKDDLKAAEMDGLKWLNSAPAFHKMAIGEDGFPVELVVPDPRYFALNKLWVSQQLDRDPVKKPRDYQQAKVVANIALNYLGMTFDEEFLQVFPESIREQIPELIKGLEQTSDSLDLLSM